MSRRFVVITPCRDEAAYLSISIASIAAQSVRPTKWIIVDDGSTDGTAALLARAAEEHSFIEIVRRTNRGARVVGAGVIDSFYSGLERINLDEYDYVCKLDADVELPKRYFERVLQRFEADPWLGNFSGKTYVQPVGSGDQLISERLGDENAIGPAKFYRVACFRDIGGFVREVSWDGIDGHMCRLKGWIALSEDAKDLRILHMRRMGSSHKSFWEGRKRWGRGKYYMGSAWYFVLVVSFYRMLERPYILSGVGILVGYILAARAHLPRFNDPCYREALRSFELRSLLFGKRRTATAINRNIRSRFNRQEGIKASRHQVIEAEERAGEASKHQGTEPSTAPATVTNR